MPEHGAPSAGERPSAAKATAAHATVLGDAKMTVDAPAYEVFAALTDSERLAAWWGQDVLIEAEKGGRYEATLPMGRVEGTITAIDGPETLAFTWPVPAEGTPVVTSVHYTLTPEGTRTVVHVTHRAPRGVSGDWNAVWRTALESLKAHCEGRVVAPTDG